MFHAYFDLFLQALARNLPWILGALAVAGMLGWSPLGRSIARALRDRSRTLELEESLGAQLSDLQRTLSEVNERLDVTEQRLFRLPAADARGKDAAKNADPPPRVATPVWRLKACGLTGACSGRAGLRCYVAGELT